MQWLPGSAVLMEDTDPLPLVACASRSVLRAVDEDARATDGALEVVRRSGRGTLQIIVNDDHGMAPSMTIVNRTDAPVRLRAVRPARVATDHGVYDLDALLADGPYLIEPGNPLVIRITDIGRNAGEPFRCGRAVSGALPLSEA